MVSSDDQNRQIAALKDQTAATHRSAEQLLSRSPENTIVGIQPFGATFTYDTVDEVLRDLRHHIFPSEGEVRNAEYAHNTAYVEATEDAHNTVYRGFENRIRNFYEDGSPPLAMISSSEFAPPHHDYVYEKEVGNFTLLVARTENDSPSLTVLSDHAPHYPRLIEALGTATNSTDALQIAQDYADNRGTEQFSRRTGKQPTYQGFSVRHTVLPPAALTQLPLQPPAEQEETLRAVGTQPLGHYRVPIPVREIATHLNTLGFDLTADDVRQNMDTLRTYGDFTPPTLTNIATVTEVPGKGSYERINGERQHVPSTEVRYTGPSVLHTRSFQNPAEETPQLRALYAATKEKKPTPSQPHEYPTGSLNWNGQFTLESTIAEEVRAAAAQRSAARSSQPQGIRGITDATTVVQLTSSPPRR